MDLREIVSRGVDWIHQPLDKDKWCSLLKMAKNLSIL
jgi:hypothetical protein